jgi:hypothetical protein
MKPLSLVFLINLRMATLMLLLFLNLGLMSSCKKEKADREIEPADNKLPVATAGSDVTITLPVDTVLLDGSASVDPDGSIRGYWWRQISGPVVRGNGTTSDTSAKMTATLTVANTYQFQLTVWDSNNSLARDTVTVTVRDFENPPGLSGREVSFENLMWDASGVDPNFSWPEFMTPQRSDLFISRYVKIGVYLKLDSGPDWYQLKPDFAEPRESLNYTNLYSINNGRLFVTSEKGNEFTRATIKVVFL